MIETFVSEGLRGKSVTTIKTYSHALQQFETWIDGSGTSLTEYSRSDVQQYIDYLESKKKSATTINKIWNAIKKYSKWSNKADTIEDISVIKQKDLTHEYEEALAR